MIPTGMEILSRRLGSLDATTCAVMVCGNMNFSL